MLVRRTIKRSTVQITSDVLCGSVVEGHEKARSAATRAKNVYSHTAANVLWDMLSSSQPVIDLKENITER